MSPVSSAEPRERLRLAIQKSGRLAEPARALLSACGLSWREGRDRLFCHGETLPVDLLLVRDDDIPGLIAEGVCDLGIVGRNVLDETNAGRLGLGLAAAARELRPLGFGACRLDIALPEGTPWSGPAQLAGLRIATSYPALLGQWLDAQGVDARVVTLSGSVEIAPRLGQADAVCDLVSSGATLAANRLAPVATLLESEAVLAGPLPPFDDGRAAIAQMLCRRMGGVLRLRDSRLLLFQASRSAVPGLLALLPDAEPPTLAAVAQDDEALLGEAADLAYHLLVLLRARGLGLADVERVLAARGA